MPNNGPENCRHGAQTVEVYLMLEVYWAYCGYFGARVLAKAVRTLPTDEILLGYSSTCSTGSTGPRDTCSTTGSTNSSSSSEPRISASPKVSVVVSEVVLQNLEILRVLAVSAVQTRNTASARSTTVFSRA